MSLRSGRPVQALSHLWHSRCPPGHFPLYAAICLLSAFACFSQADEIPLAILPKGEATPAELNERLVRLISGKATPSTIDDLRTIQTQTQKLSETFMPVTVGVQVGNAQGSGVIITKDGYVLTAAHVSGTANREVVFYLSDGRILRGKTLGLNRSMDAGLMKITDGGDFPFAPMGDSNALREGQWCIATGHPGGFQPDRKPVVRLGRVLLISDSNLTTDCTLVGGDSGGPLFDMHGRVIGINSKIQQKLESNMHVPCNTFRDTWERLVKGEQWGHYEGQEPFIGLRGDADGTEAKVTKVVSDSPAAKAGVKEDDVITAINDKAVTNFASVTAAIRERQPGEKVRLRVKRGETLLELTVLIAKRGG